MHNTKSNINFPNPNTDSLNLMDLRVDYAFKLLFAFDGTSRLISLLNAIFANKGIPRTVKKLTIQNPNIEKQSKTDKYSILDIKAELGDNSIVCIEMHLYGLKEFKHKSVRSWAKVYASRAKSGKRYKSNPVICISFINGAIKYADGSPVKKIHSVFEIAERDEHKTLTNDMEMHYINMKGFVKALNGKDYKTFETKPDMFTKWLAFITQKEIQNKEILEMLCKEEEFKVAAKTLALLSQDTIKRLEYERRQDEIAWHKMVVRQRKAADRRTEEAIRQKEEYARLIEEYARQKEKADKEIAELREKLRKFEENA